MKIMETGKLDQIIKTHRGLLSDCPTEEIEEAHPLSIFKLTFMFLIILTGMSIAMIVFIIENCYKCS